MWKFLRCMTFTFLIGALFAPQAMGLPPALAGSRIWKSPAVTDGLVVRIDGRLYVVTASLSRTSSWWAWPVIGPRNSHTMFVSIRAADYGTMPDIEQGASVTLLAAGRPVWRSPLFPQTNLSCHICLPSDGSWQYVAPGVPSRRVGSVLTAHIDLRTGQGTTRVRVHLVVPPPLAAYGI